MALWLLFRPGRDDQISYLRWREASQPAHALNLADLIGHPMFELLVKFDDLVRPLMWSRVVLTPTLPGNSPAPRPEVVPNHGWNYLGLLSPGALLRSQMVSAPQSLISLGCASIGSVLGSAWEA